MLTPSSLKPTCDVCRLPFDPVKGGVCPTCRRLLCPQHMFGSPLVRLWAVVGGRPSCVDCRAGQPPTTRKSSTAGKS